MTTLWKALVIAILVYAIYLHRKLLYLTDAAYVVASKARFPTVEDPTHSLRDTMWGREVIQSMNTMMYAIIALAVIAVGRDLIRFGSEHKPPPADAPPADAPPADAPAPPAPPAV